MGDSTCLMQPFCYASGVTNEANESNTIHALGQSISFGRFMSESMAWEKWSSFSHNRYVEEAERYAKPGSVAQKKAFFEAHYKKLAAQKAAAAAALLEQQAINAEAPNNAAAPNNEGEVVDSISTLDSQRTSPNSKMIVKEEQDSEALNLIHEEPDIMLKVKTNVHDSNSDVKRSYIPESDKIDEKKIEEKPLIGSSMKVELLNQLEYVDTHKEEIEKLSETTTPQIMTPILKGSDFDQEVLASQVKKKPPVSLSKLLNATRTSKFTSTPLKSTAPISSKRDTITTPMNNNNKPSSDRKRYTPKSLQMPVTFTPIREINRFTASVMKKFESTRTGAGSSKASKDSLTPLRTPTMASKVMQKHPSLTSLTKKNRNKTPIDLSDSGNRAAGSIWRLLSSENKTRSPVISSPFNLRTEERAARRQKATLLISLFFSSDSKLEEKFNAYEAQKVHLQTKIKEKKETEIMRKLRRSFCFKAKPLPDFYKERKASKDETKKEEGRKITPRHNLVESKISLPLNKPSLRCNVNKKFNGNSTNTMIHHKNSYSRMVTTLENTSPNILHGNHID
ncbi:hypothetical protein Lalb_Chr21g0317641 [Lupinus albus]|uniref:TPX2 C-terminal domain-containing protein n=1 Tax=Lupinus albus TaxID=3870 RepID=A0A6A4NLM7_LUPAL|nr:hypothetical protein Lalb_Chr21g0317641 [Lupinus albus]